MKESIMKMVLGAAIGASLVYAGMTVGSPPRAMAQVTGGVFGGYTLSASPRKDTDKNESFIFVNQETGDIWIYMDANPREHYRFKKIGEPLEKETVK